MTSMAMAAACGVSGSVMMAVGASARKAASGHRAQGVSWAQRASRFLFGSPSLRRAAGGVRTSLRPHALKTQGWKAKRAAVPVFWVDRKGPEHAERLPRIWVTEPAFDLQTGERMGRAYVGAYPSDPDRGGWRALELGNRYFAEGLAGCEGSSEPEAARHRVECFRAAEILLLHSARRGNLKACVRLGTLYAGDLCEGRYWRGLLETRAGHAPEADPARKAFAWLSRAALKGDSEACRQLGTLLVEGRGCVADPSRAFTLFTRALLHGQGEEQLGLAALSLARCFERAQGCRLNLESALKLYRQGAEWLQRAFDEGSWHCKRSLLEARTGSARMVQELDGRY